MKYKKRKEFSSVAHFKNVTCNEASKELLKLQSRGSYIIRPSPKGERFITLTLNYYKNHLVNIEIEEIKSEFTAKYKIKDQEFDSLQEIEIRYVKEFNKRVKEVLD